MTWRTVRLTNRRINNASFLPPVPFVHLVLALFGPVNHLNEFFYVSVAQSCSFRFMFLLDDLYDLPETERCFICCSLCIIITSHMWFNLLFFPPYKQFLPKRDFSVAVDIPSFVLMMAVERLSNTSVIWSHHIIMSDFMSFIQLFPLICHLCVGALWGTEEI